MTKIKDSIQDITDAVFSFSYSGSYATIKQLEYIAKETEEYGEEIVDGK